MVKRFCNKLRRIFVMIPLLQKFFIKIDKRRKSKFETKLGMKSGEQYAEVTLAGSLIRTIFSFFVTWRFVTLERCLQSSLILIYKSTAVLPGKDTDQCLVLIFSLHHMILNIFAYTELLQNTLWWRKALLKTSENKRIKCHNVHNILY